MINDASITLRIKGWSMAKLPSCAFLRSSTQQVPDPSCYMYICGLSVGGPTVTNNGTKKNSRLLPPSKSGSDTLFNSRSSSSLSLQIGRRTGPAIKQRRAG